MRPLVRLVTVVVVEDEDDHYDSPFSSMMTKTDSSSRHLLHFQEGFERTSLD